MISTATPLRSSITPVGSPPPQPAWMMSPSGRGAASSVPSICRRVNGPFSSRTSGSFSSTPSPSSRNTSPSRGQHTFRSGLAGTSRPCFGRSAASEPDYTLFYNGPRSGASAPDHMHFQVGTRDFMPIDHEAPALLARYGRGAEAGVAMCAWWLSAACCARSLRLESRQERPLQESIERVISVARSE